MNINIGLLKVNYVAGGGGINIGTTFHINPITHTQNQIGTQNNGDGNSMVTYNPIYDPDVIDFPAYTNGYY
ncbi:spore germination protein [Neobacillus ginsengisoli]|uniref:Outer membrane phospholipase A n=1 Tax=Neobacillus ginsengisoli TaxID=904295 RepID=A0ABT9XX77_9BACI|nr:spore germination protein [Neobacillus ginsengisoli]MDQ0200153.1 outer membrane phospholipase A [Neobacillus ginsengisoli]